MYTCHEDAVRTLAWACHDTVSTMVAGRTLASAAPEVVAHAYLEQVVATLTAAVVVFDDYYRQAFADRVEVVVVVVVEVVVGIDDIQVAAACESVDRVHVGTQFVPTDDDDGPSVLLVASSLVGRIQR